MSPNMMVLDMSKVTRGMNMLDVAIKKRMRIGLTMAGNRLMVDALTKSKTVPIKRPDYGGEWSAAGWSASERKAGELRASGALFVDGVKMRSAEHYGEFATGKYQPNTYGGEPILPMSHEACVVFNAPYALEQHNQWPYKSEPGAGRYYLSSKLYENGVVYMTIVAEAIKL